MEKLLNEIKQAIIGGMSPGCSLVVLKKGKNIINFSSGCFSNTDKTTITSDTFFDLASITKLYMAAVILQLEKVGKIRIQDKAAEYLSVFSESELTILDLLTHRANFGLRLSEYREKYQEKFETKIFNVVPPRKASLGVHYENITFLFLGRIAEVVCRKPLAEIFSDFFVKLKLKNTNLGLRDQKIFVSPPTEIRTGQIIQNSTHDESADLMGGVAGNAGVFASAKDLAKFGNMWLEKKIVSEKKFKNIFTDYSQTGTRSQGLGWHQDLYGWSTKNQEVYLHSGYTGGLLAIHLPSFTVCAFVCNRTYYGRDNIKYRKMLKLLVDYISL